MHRRGTSGKWWDTCWPGPETPKRIEPPKIKRKPRKVMPHIPQDIALSICAVHTCNSACVLVSHTKALIHQIHKPGMTCGSLKNRYTPVAHPWLFKSDCNDDEICQFEYTTHSVPPVPAHLSLLALIPPPPRLLPAAPSLHLCICCPLLQLPTMPGCQASLLTHPSVRPASNDCPLNI